MGAAVLPVLVDIGRLDDGRIANALTVDVEEYFQVAAFERTIPRKSWADAASRVEFSTGRVLDLFAARGVKGTFFTLGWIAEKHPGLVKRIVADGHELASHGYDHTRLHQFTAEQFRADVIRTKAILENIGGVAVRGYRAPSYSINSSNLWALDVLQETGHLYSSSIYPIRHDLYGMPEAPAFSIPIPARQHSRDPRNHRFDRATAIFRAVVADISGWCHIRCSAGPCGASMRPIANQGCFISIPGKSIPTSLASRALR